MNISQSKATAMNASIIAGELPSSSISERPHPMPQNFCAFVPYACTQLEAPFCVKINVQKQAEYIRVEEKIKRPRSQRSRGHTSRHAVAAEEQESEASRETCRDVQLVAFTAVQDAAGNLLELVFNGINEIPVMLIKVIALCVPYQPQLYKLTVKWTPLSTVTIYEFSKLSKVTEVCLDGSPLAGRNYHLLLEPPSRLYYLSLVSCKLDDEDCAQLAELLTPPRAAAVSLHVLLLASNKIGDKGARALAQTLRSNRGLHYLNLAGNCITDSGAISIFKNLMEFPITKEEMKEKGLRQIKFLRRRANAYANFTKELMREDKSATDDVRVIKRYKPIRGTKAGQDYSAADTIAQRANIMTDKLVGTFTDPFSKDKTVVHGDKLYCVGNMALCGLNLSYNNLQFPSITCLWNVLKQQSCLQVAARSEPGLLRVRVDGNNLPSSCCEEVQCVDELLERAVVRVSRQFAAEGAAVGKGGRSVSTKSKLLSSSRTAVSHKSPSV